MEDATAFGTRLRELRNWRGLTLREAAGLAGLSFSFWGQVERGEQAVNNRKTLEAIVTALRVHPTELSGQPWITPRDAAGAEAHAGLMAIETALERYELGTDPELPVRDWPQIQADLDRLEKLRRTADYASQGELAPALIGELHGAYVRLPQRRREVLLGLMMAYSVAMWTTKRLGDRGLPALAARAVQQCAEALGDVVWLGYAAWLRGDATGHLDRAAQYRRSVAAAENLTGELDCGEALQACGMLHLSAALAAGAQADHATAATHLGEASALAARMDTEVGSWHTCGSGRPTSASGAPRWRSSSASPARPSKSRRRCTLSCCPPPSAKRSSGSRSAGPWWPRGRPGRRACGRCCAPSGSPRSGSELTCSFGKRSRTCCAVPAATLAGASCAGWRGGWGSPRSGEPASFAPLVRKSAR